MSEFVRVKDPNTGAEFTVTAQHAENAGLTPIDKPAVDEHGRVLPAKTDPLKTSAKEKTA